MAESEQDTARPVVPPPVVYLGALVIGLLLGVVFPTPFLSGWIPVAIGVVLVAIGLVGAVSAIATMRRTGESPIPTAPTRTLVVNGPFQFTRNPIYLSFTLIDVGIAIAFSALWVLALLVPVLLIMDRIVIVSEEQYLERRLGDAYMRYKARVRRWI